MSDDFYCEQVLSGKLQIRVAAETGNVLAFYHTRPYWLVHIVVIPKRHVESLVSMTAADDALLLEIMGVVRQVAEKMTAEQGGCHVVTNLGKYQDSKHLHFHVGSGETLK